MTIYAGKHIPLLLHFTNPSEENNVNLGFTKRTKPWTDRQKHWAKETLCLNPTFLSIVTQLRVIKIFVSMKGKFIKNEGGSDAKKIDLECKSNGSQNNTKTYPAHT